MSPLLIVAGAFVAAGIGTLVSIPWVRRWALRSMMDVPSERSSHEVPTPRGGGLPIALVVCVLAVLAAEVEPLEGGLVLGAVLFGVGLTGLVDDARGLGAGVRFLVQFGAAFALVAFAGSFEELALPLAGTFHLAPWLASTLAVVWVVGLTNTYNFMDGIDGIAGVQAVVAGIAWTVVALTQGVTGVALITGGLVGATLGFLRYNWHPASIFMGDVASTSLGLLFAALPLVYPASHPETDPRLPFMAAAVVGPFILDAGFTFARRALRGENVLTPHRSHVYQRLVISGLSHATVALLYLGACSIAAVGSVAWLFEVAPDWVPPVTLLAPFAALLLTALARESNDS